MTVFFVLSGCASVRDFLGKIESGLTPSTRAAEPMMTYEDIMATQNVRMNPSNTNNVYANANANGYRYVPPVVQKLNMPAMVRNGVLIPTHEEYVIINDASYVMDNDRSNSIRSKYPIPDDVQIVSPLKGSDVVVAVFRMNPVFAQSTIVPLNKVAFLFQGKAMDRALSLMNDEIQQVGSYLVSFNRDKGDEFVTVNVAENGLKGVKQYSVTKSQMIFLSNGYVLIPMFERGNRKGDS